MQRHNDVHLTDTQERTRTGMCPTCGCEATFTFVGEQRWPEKVARAAGLPVVTQLWTCNCCNTTLAEAQDGF